MNFNLSTSILKNLKWVFFLSICSTLILVGCGPSQNEIKARESLEGAQKAYSKAKTNPKVQTYAPLSLLEAEKAIKAAERSKDDEEMEHLAYMARRKVNIAEAIAEDKAALKETEDLNRENSELLLKKELVQTRQEAIQARMQALKSKAEAEQLLKELSDLKAKQTDRGIVLTLGDVLFATGKADLSTGAIRNIDKLVDFLKKYPTRNVLIEGHTDIVGSDEYNLTLSQKRAESVKELLVSKGIETKRITTQGYGKKYPIAENDTAEGRQQNRRVEVLILNEGVNPESIIR